MFKPLHLKQPQNCMAQFPSQRVQRLEATPPQDDASVPWSMPGYRP